MKTCTVVGCKSKNKNPVKVIVTDKGTDYMCEKCFKGFSNSFGYFTSCLSVEIKDYEDNKKQ